MVLFRASPTLTQEAFVAFELPGEPLAWGRPRATIRWKGGHPFIHWYIAAEEERYRESVSWAAKAAMRGKPPTDKPVSLLVQAFLPIPKSWTKKKQELARTGALLPTGKPDVDNLGKGVADSLKSIVWLDDAAVVDGRVVKRYAERPTLLVEVHELIP